LNFAGTTQSQLSESVAAYRAAIGRSTLPPRRVTNQFCCTPVCLVLDSDKEACALGFRGARYHQQGLAHYFFSPQRTIGSPGFDTAPLGPDALDKEMKARHDPGRPLNTAIGDPVAVLENVRRFKHAGVDELILVMQMGTIPHEAVMRSLKLFAERVMAIA
jgi:alkanesulfonate monooxygenase SsuD/methylene tetrahydromethanopterin reductase-like flavin-dependent oxidoreductase (luciferase family)